VDRLACVDVPALALQLLVQRHPDWRDHPAAVVAADTPQGEILEINSRARRAGVLTGLRYAAALSLCPQLRAGTISRHDIDEGVARVTTRLNRHSPRVEPCGDEPGVFWLDASGLERLHRSQQSFARGVRTDLERIDFTSTVAAGFTRFCTYALARSARGAFAFESRDEEQRLARRVRLVRLGLPPVVRDDLLRLGVTTVGELLVLPRSGLLERFGREVHRLHRMAAGDLWSPLLPRETEAPITELAQLDSPDDNAARLTFLVKQMLPPLLGRLADRGAALAELEIGLALDHSDDRTERIRPAAPTLEERQIIDLVRLRLEALSLEAGVTEVALKAQAVPATIEQLELFADGQRRDLAAGDRALARLRAELGSAAVVRARLVDGHLPEARFVWEPLEKLAFPDHSRPARGEAPLQAFGTPPPVAASHSEPLGKLDTRPPTEDRQKKLRPLIRRIYTKPIPLHTRPFRGPGGIHLRGMGHEPVIRVTGPYVISGGWWHREITREYHFAETVDGQILWVYFDRRRRRWFVQGTVE
jgi:protein ImuB